MADFGEARGKITLQFDDGGSIDKAKSKLGEAGEAAEGFGKRSEGVKKVLNTTGTTALAAGGTIAAGFAVAVKAASDFEFGMSAIQAVSGATADEMDLINAAALRIGKDTSFSASEAASAIEELVKAGVSVTDVLGGAADATVALAAAGGVDLPTAATIASNAMNQFGLAAEDLVGVTDTIAGAANASAIDMGQFALSMSQVGAVAKLAGATFEDTSTAIALMGNAGIVGSDAGTSLKQVLLNLNPTTEKQTNLMRELGIVTEDGANQFYNANGSLKSMAEVSDVLKNSLAGMTDQQKQATLETLFGSDAIRGAAVLAGAGAEGFDAMAASIGKVSAADVASTRLENTKGGIEALKGSAETLAIMVGQILLPRINEMVSALTGALDGFLSMSSGAQQAVVSIVGIVGGVLLAVGALSKMAAAGIAMREALLLATGANTLFATSTKGLSAAQMVAAAATRVFNAALRANPIIFIVSAILAVLAAIVTLAGGWDQLRAAFQPVMDSLQSAVQSLLPVIVSLADSVVGILVAAFEALMPIIQTLAETLFPVILQVINALVPIISSLASILAAVLGPVLGVVGALFEALAPIITALLTALQPLIDLLLAVLVPVLDAVVWVLQILADALTWVADQITAFFQTSSDGTSDASAAWGEFVSFLTDIWTAVLAFLQPAIDLIVQTWQNMALVVTTIWNAIMTVIGVVVTWFQTYVAPVIQAAVNLVVAIFTFLYNTAMVIWNQIMAVIGAVVAWFQAYVAPLISAVINLVVAIFQFLLGIIIAVWTQIFSVISGVVTNVVNFISSVWGAIIGFVTPIFQAIFNFISNVFKNIFTAVSTVVNNVKNFIQSGWQALVSIVSGIFGPIYNAIKDPLQQALDFIGGIQAKIMGFFANAGSWLLNAGKNIIDGLIKGVQNALGGLTSVLNGITNMIPKVKGPPAKDKVLLKPAGELIMGGFISSIQDKIPSLLGVLSGLNVSIPAALDADLSAQRGAAYRSTGEGDDNRQFIYNAAPGAAQLSGEQEFFVAIKRSKVVVPGWAG